jgi:uncharacterized protein YodC (DUF2158 family)
VILPLRINRKPARRGRRSSFARIAQAVSKPGNIGRAIPQPQIDVIVQRTDKQMESAMFTRQAAIAAAVALGMALGVPSTTKALAEPALPEAATQGSATPQFQNGDLVHLRPGGPLMTITGIQGDQANCIWSEPDGRLRSGQFPVALLSAPITLPKDEE